MGFNENYIPFSRLIIQEFYYSLNRKHLIANGQVDEEITKTLTTLSSEAFMLRQSIRKLYTQPSVSSPTIGSTGKYKE